MQTGRVWIAAAVAACGVMPGESLAGPRVAVGVTFGGPPVPYYRPYPPPYFYRSYPPPYFYPRPYYGVYAVPPPVVVVEQSQPIIIQQPQPTVVYQQAPAPQAAVPAVPRTSAYPDEPAPRSQPLPAPTPGSGLPLPPPPAMHYPPVPR